MCLLRCGRACNSKAFHPRIVSARPPFAGGFCLLLTDSFLPFFKYRRRKMSPLSEKWGHHDLRILRFERTASTAAVRTHGNFGSIPSPYSVDVERKLRSKSAAKVYEQSMRESLARRPFLKLESFATRCEILGCSRQNIIDLTKRGKLHPIKSSEKSILYLKSGILKRNWQ